jgi:hypothetical protein
LIPLKSLGMVAVAIAIAFEWDSNSGSFRLIRLDLSFHWLKKLSSSNRKGVLIFYRRCGTHLKRFPEADHPACTIKSGENVSDPCLSCSGLRIINSRITFSKSNRFLNQSYVFSQKICP